MHLFGDFSLIYSIFQFCVHSPFNFFSLFIYFPLFASIFPIKCNPIYFFRVSFPFFIYSVIVLSFCSFTFSLFIYIECNILVDCFYFIYIFNLLCFIVIHNFSVFFAFFRFMYNVHIQLIFDPAVR